MFYLIGLGLGDAKDITVKGLEIIKKCDKVFLEAYTSILTVGKDSLVSFIKYYIHYTCIEARGTKENFEKVAWYV